VICRPWKSCNSDLRSWRHCCRSVRPASPKAAWRRRPTQLAMRQLGYRLALIGTALMSCDDPTVLLEEILEAARTPRA